MQWIDFSSHSVFLNVLIFFGTAFFVWVAGTRLAYTADAIAEKTTLGQAFVGTVLLASATSLPELATSFTAASLGSAPLAVNNLMGGIAMQLAILAVMDFLFVKKALTYFPHEPVLLMNGVLMIVLIAIALAGLSLGDIDLVFHVGFWPLLLFLAYLLNLYVLRSYEGKNKWAPVDLPNVQSAGKTHRNGAVPSRYTEKSKSKVYLEFIFYSLVVLCAGWTVSHAVHALSLQTALSGGFLGGTLAAISTSLPEVSTTAGAIRLGSYTLAFSNIFGSNSIMMGLFLYADMVYRDAPIFNHADSSGIYFGSIGIIAGAFYLWGILERRDKVFLRLGVDSWLVLLTYLGGITFLYFKS